MGPHVLLLYIRVGVCYLCYLCYAFCNSPWPRCSVLELAFSKTKIRSFSKANSRLSTIYLEHESTRFTISLLDLLLVYRVASHSSICKTIIIIIIYTIYNYSLDIIPARTVSCNTLGIINIYDYNDHISLLNVATHQGLCTSVLLLYMELFLVVICAIIFSFFLC